MQALTGIDIRGLKIFSRGKVRDIYDLGDKLLIVASDRISAFDYVLPTGIPDKGKVLTGISSFWFKKLEPVSRHHMITHDVEEFPSGLNDHVEILRDRSMLTWKAKRIDIECIVRGYLSGSAWKEYSGTGQVAGQVLAPDLEKDARLDSPLFTPTTKSEDGHDRNITVRDMCSLVGSRQTEYIMAKSLSLFHEASGVAEGRGITLVDTKFEFGYFEDGIILIDEVLTPDSSRFWVKDEKSGQQVNLDKQFIRDFLERTAWDKNSPPPELPPEIVTEVRRRYLALFERLTGDRPAWER
jgi:phosphoribosylaminoimidazole-succinocarboxamide synthase